MIQKKVLLKSARPSTQTNKIPKLQLINLSTSRDLQTKSKSRRFIKTSCKFQKQKNKVQTNKQNINYKDSHLTIKLTPLNNPNTNNNHINNTKANSNNTSNINKSNINVNTQRNQYKINGERDFGLNSRYQYGMQEYKSIKSSTREIRQFKPLNKELIQRKHGFKHQLDIKIDLVKGSPLMSQCKIDKKQLQKLLVKNKIYGQRCLLGQNIPKIQQLYEFSRFELFNLYAYYKTLLTASKKSLPQFRHCFQTILHMQGIALNFEMVQKCFISLFEQISFPNFIKVYGNIQNLLFTQTIIQHLNQVFINYYRDDQLSKQKVQRLFAERMQSQDASEVTNVFWEYLGRNDGLCIKVSQLIDACSQSMRICRMVFNIMSRIKDGKKKPIG